MKNEKETKEKLLIHARKEFMEKGYAKASLRNICKNAGVTTGALYFFFKDKEDLFASLVEEPLDNLYEVMMTHFRDELLVLDKGTAEKGEHADDEEAAMQIVHYLYQYYEELQLVLTKSQGSSFENIVDRFVAVNERHNRILADRLAQERGIPPLDEYLIHWTSHLIVDVFVYMITHEISEKEALKHVRTIVKFLTNGWYGMLGISAAD